MVTTHGQDIIGSENTLTMNTAFLVRFARITSQCQKNQYPFLTQSFSKLSSRLVSLKLSLAVSSLPGGLVGSHAMLTNCKLLSFACLSSNEELLSFSFSIRKLIPLFELYFWSKRRSSKAASATTKSKDEKDNTTQFPP